MLTGRGRQRAHRADGIRPRASSAGAQGVEQLMPAIGAGSRAIHRRVTGQENADEPQAAPHGGQAGKNPAQERGTARGGRRCRQEGDCRRTSWRGRARRRPLSTKCWRAFLITSKPCTRRACCWRAQTMSRTASCCCGERPLGNRARRFTGTIWRRRASSSNGRTRRLPPRARRRARSEIRDGLAQSRAGRDRPRAASAGGRGAGADGRPDPERCGGVEHAGPCVP